MKNIFKSLLVLVALTIGVTNVDAKLKQIIDVDKVMSISASEKDPDDLVSFPFSVYNGEGDITIDDSLTDYTMYYQWIELSSEQISNLEAADKAIDDYNALATAELEDLEEVYNERKATYDALVADSSSTEDEIEAARLSVNEAAAACNDYVEAANTEIQRLVDVYYGLIPDYDNNKWTQATGTHFQGDFSYYTDERQFVLWVKVDTASTDIYDFGILIINGTYEEPEGSTDYQSYWEDFVESFKTIKSKEGLFALSENDDYTVTNTDSELKIVYKDEFTTIFTYEKGVIKYKVSEDENTALIDNFLITHAVYALADMKGYDFEDLNAWIEAQEESGLSLATHGIEFTTVAYTYQDEDGTVNTDRFTKFMMDIVGGIKYTSVGGSDADPDANAPKDDIVENPKTGIVTYTLAIVGTSAVAGGIYYFLRKKNLIKKI